MEPASSVISLYEKFLRCGSVSTDSRNITSGSIFFALRGTSFDGNSFAISALEQGAAYAVCDDPRLPEEAPAGLSDRIVMVRDSLTALQQLAAHHRYELGIPVLAITGSNGKTTTKELVSRVLARRFAVSVTLGNLNNHIGVPLTLLQMGPLTQFGIVEMGAGAPGEIALLCRIAQPNYGIVTNTGLAHLEGFGDLEGVKRGKGELFDYLAANGGVAFYCSDDPDVSGMAAVRKDLHTVPFSKSAGEVPNNLEGDYNIYNIAAAAAIGGYFEVGRDRILEAIAGYVPDNNRSQRIVTAHNTLIADCYNANPSSMRAAIENFSRSSYGDHPQKAVILGDMLELGASSAARHAEILELAASFGIGKVYLVGPYFVEAARAVDRGGAFTLAFQDASQLLRHLRQNPLSGHSILVKGSRGMRLETVLEAL